MGKLGEFSEGNLQESGKNLGKPTWDDKVSGEQQ